MVLPLGLELTYMRHRPCNHPPHLQLLWDMQHPPNMGWDTYHTQHPLQPVWDPGSMCPPCLCPVLTVPGQALCPELVPDQFEWVPHVA